MSNTTERTATEQELREDALRHELAELQAKQKPLVEEMNRHTRSIDPEREALMRQVRDLDDRIWAIR